MAQEGSPTAPSTVAWHRSVQMRIGLGFLVALVLLSVVVLGAFHVFGRRAIIRQSLERVDQVGATLVAELSGTIGRGETLCRGMAWISQASGPRDSGFPETLGRLLHGEGAASMVAGGGFWPEPRAFDPKKERASLFWGREPDGRLKFYEGYNDPAGEGYHRREWYAPVRHLQPGQAFWSRSYMDPYSFQPMVTCSVPLLREGRFVGVQTVDLRLEGLREYLGHASLQGGYAFVLDRNGTFVSFPDEAQVKEVRQDAEGRTVQALLHIRDFAAKVSAFSPVAQAIADEHQRQLRSVGMDHPLALRLDAESDELGREEARLIAAQMLHRGTETMRDPHRIARISLAVDPVIKAASLVSLYHMPESDWVVGVVIPTQAATVSASRISRFLVWSLLAALVLPLGGAYLLVRRHVVQPLQRMSHAVEIASGIDTTSASPLLESARGDELGVLATAFNRRTSQLGETMASLSRREREYRSLFENMQDLFYRTDLDGRLTLVSPSLEPMLGYLPEEVLGQPLGQSLYLVPEERQRLLEQIQRDGRARDFEARLRRKDGRVIWGSSNSQVCLNEAGEAVGVEGTVRDITSRKEAEQAIVSMRAYLENILNAMPSILIATDAEGRIQEWNHSANAVLLDPGTAKGRPFWEAAPALGRYRDELAGIMESRQPKRFQRETQAGTAELYFDTTLYPFEVEGRAGLVIRLDDVSELERKDRQLRQVQKMETLGVLAGGLAHDFNNVLGAIMGTLSLLRFRMEDGEVSRRELESDLGVVESAARRAVDIVQQLLTLSRKQELTLTATDLNKAIAHVVSLCRGSLDKSVQLEVLAPSEPAFTLGDPGQIEQILLNLCVNGAHAMTIMRPPHAAQGGTLTLTLQKIYADPIFCAGHPEATPADYWQIEVRDTGVGIDTTTAAKVFDPFFTTKDKGQGTGLGLAMVFSMVRAHGGFINLYSEPGRGTTFTVYLLAHVGLEQPRSQARRLNLPKGEGRILVVDDEPVLRENAHAMLHACGYETVEAVDGLDGVRCFEADPASFKAVILDMAMPRLDGRATCERMLAIRRDIPILLTSGFRKDARIDAALEMGARGFLSKPYTLEGLVQALARLLESED